MNRELELKLVADAAFEESALLRHLERHARVGEASERVQKDIYLDTSAGELAAAGLSARLRQAGEGRTVEVKPVPIDPQLIRDRAELRAPVDDQHEPADVLRKLLADRLGVELRGDPLVVVGLRTRRRRFDVHTPSFEAELCVDHVQLDSGGGFREVELELSNGDALAFRALAQTLTAVPGLQPSRKSKVERARVSAGLAPFSYGVSLPQFDEDETLGAVARGVGSSLLRTMLAYEPGTRVGLDPEHLHKMRVATRRLRTALRVFRRAFDRDERKALEGELRWFGGVLGHVRDLDVHLLELPHWIARFGTTPGDGWASFERVLLRNHHEARARLHEALDDPRYAALVRRASALFDVEDDATDEAREPVRGAGRKILSVRVAKFREAVERFRQTHAADDAHRVRIVGKRLRYTARFLEPLLDDGAKCRLGDLATFQDRLGAMQDVVAAGELAQRLRDEAMRADPDPGQMYVLGQLTGAAAMAIALVRPVVDHALDELDAEALLDALG